MRGRWQRLADGFPPTGRGLVLGALSAAALWIYGYGALDLVVFALGISGLALLALASLGVSVTAWWLRRRLAGARPRPGAAGPARMETGAWARTGFALPDWRWLPLVKLEWHWLEPRGVECRAALGKGGWGEEIRPSRRALTDRVRRHLGVFDTFGLARVRFEHVLPGALLVLPDPGHLRQAPVVASLAGADGIPYPSGAPEGDRMEIRRYAPGDSVRDILWKTYARTRQLSVRTRERSVERSRRLVAYLVAAEGDEAAAAAARVALESGALGEDWLFGADGSPEPAEDLDGALRAVARSGSAPPGPTRLAGFLESAGAGAGMHCVVFAPGRAGDWAVEVARVARLHPGRLSCVLGCDRLVQRGRPTALWRRLFFEDAPAPGVPAEEVAEVEAALARSGASTLVVDRSTGRCFGRGAATAAAAGA